MKYSIIIKNFFLVVLYFFISFLLSIIKPDGGSSYLILFGLVFTVHLVTIFVQIIKKDEFLFNQLLGIFLGLFLSIFIEMQIDNAYSKRPSYIIKYEEGGAVDTIWLDK